MPDALPTTSEDVSAKAIPVGRTGMVQPKTFPASVEIPIPVTHPPQVSNKEVFHDVSPTGNFLIVGSCRAIRQEDEVKRAASPCFCFSVPPSHSCRTCDV